ncbi:PREDICTED: uncharacterized protein LOC109166502 [Ipomoea nil]|uniref:uncharacterized protein LOC109166502 n=1 Tax=Ipomoea nil TaxID=35883 RepID=UPI0009015F5F|nr:PREDICTED: uncharacterized protein LOC109166502 [Ipomoea nil]
MRLSQFDIQFKPRPAIKGQALADFIVECTAWEATERVPNEDEEWWTLSTDGSSSTKGCGGEVVLINQEGFQAYYAIRFAFKLSNNETEYEALLRGLCLALNMRVEKLKIRCDSRLLVGQVIGEFEASDERMRSRVAVCYPQTNGQVENANRTIVDGLKKKLESAGGAWVEELDAIILAYRTTPRRATGETPFSLAYSLEALAPAEAVIPSRRDEDYDADTNDEYHRADLHLVDDMREAAAI